MPKAPIAEIAQHTANLTAMVIVIYHQRLISAADNAFMRCGFKLFKHFVRNHCPKLAPVDATSVRCTASPAPAIKPIPLFVVRWEEF
jgi:hypothetical protein